MTYFFHSSCLKKYISKTIPLYIKFFFSQCLFSLDYSWINEWHSSSQWSGGEEWRVPLYFLVLSWLWACLPKAPQPILLFKGNRCFAPTSREYAIIAAVVSTTAIATQNNTGALSRARQSSPASSTRHRLGERNFSKNPDSDYLRVERTWRLPTSEECARCRRCVPENNG